MIDADLRNMVGHIMGEMKGLFPSNMRLTLVIRNSDILSTDVDTMISEDQVDMVIKALQKIQSEMLLTQGLAQ